MGLLNNIFGNDKKEAGAGSRKGSTPESLPKKSPVAEWQNSKVQLEFLARFFHGADPWTFIGKEHWIDVLDSKVEHVIEYLREKGALQPAPLDLTLRHRFSSADLQYQLSERGLDAAGSQEEMIGRLVDADREGMNALIADSNVLVLSDEARKAVLRYVRSERERRETAERKSLVGLLQKDFLRAAITVGEFQKDSVFSRGVGATFSNDDHLENVQFLQNLFEKTPALLADIDNNMLDALRPPAGMAYLWGHNSSAVWIPEDSRSEGQFDADTICTMLRMYARFLMDVEKFRTEQRDTIRIWSRTDDQTCTACRSLQSEVYSLDTLPELPHAGCTSTQGCRCGLAVFDQAF
jgi:hypothetical protein